MRRTKERVWAFLAVLFACLMAARPFTALAAEDKESRVFDQAGLLTGDQRETFEEEISGLRRKMGMDVVVVTTDDAGGKEAGAYAEDFYVAGGFGEGKDYSGILFLIDMDNRELYVAPVGAMNRYITDERWETMMDHAYAEAGAENFAACVEGFLEDTEAYYKKGIPSNQYNYDRDTGKISVHRSIRWYEALLAFGVASFSGAAACLAVRRQYAMTDQRKQAGGYHMAYRADCKFCFEDETDTLVGKNVSQMVIPRRTNPPGGTGGRSGSTFSGRSTTHTSSGRTFGGGGRKF